MAKLMTSKLQLSTRSFRLLHEERPIQIIKSGRERARAPAAIAFYKKPPPPVFASLLPPSSPDLRARSHSKQSPILLLLRQSPSSFRSSSSAAMGILSGEEGPSRRFWQKFSKERVFAQYTPFVVCLASGKLELDTFRQYIAQDVHFLRAFARASVFVSSWEFSFGGRGIGEGVFGFVWWFRYEMAAECADDDDAKVSMAELRRAVLKEMNMHDSVVQEWGVDVTKESPPNLATAKYTDFLLATAAGKIEGGKGPIKIATPFEKTKVAAYALGAMTPCMRLYAYLGKETCQFLEPDGTGHAYKKWIDSYSSESFEASALQIEDLLDKLSISLTGEELEIVEKLYHQAIKLEIDFFYSQPISQQTVVPLSRMWDPAEHQLTIFSDFDLTCSVVDSSAILAEIAILTSPKVVQDVPENINPRKSSVELRKSWDDLSKLYTEEHEECIESIIPGEHEEAFNYEGLCKALEQLSDFEKRANSRVIDSGVLKGLNLEDIKRAGERLMLQDGCVAFFQQIVNKKEELNVDFHIVSYCWCGDLIRSAFSSVCPCGQESVEPMKVGHTSGKLSWDPPVKELMKVILCQTGGLGALNIHANEFNYEESISTGEIIKKMESPMDKVQAFKDILKSRTDSCNHLSVYIGDSVGDLLCLLEADIGIVVGSSSSLRRVGRHFGVSFIPLFTGVVKKQRECVGGDSSTWKGLSGILYTDHPESTEAWSLHISLQAFEAFMAEDSPRMHEFICPYRAID
ncbi:hypothetical protein ACLOJK_007567 [Asimina triloba]